MRHASTAPELEPDAGGTSAPGSSPVEHDCAYRQEAEELRARVDGLSSEVEALRAASAAEIEALRTASAAEVEALRTASTQALNKYEQELAGLKKWFLGKSEKMPPPDRELKKRKPAKDPAATQRKRRANAAVKEGLEQQRIVHPLPSDLSCDKCGGSRFIDVGSGKETVEYEFVPGYFVRRVHVQEVKACTCGGCIITAPAPARVFDKARYGPGFLAYLVVAKCEDSLPIYRLEKQFKRLGIPIARSTMNEQFHRVAELLSPLYQRMLIRIAAMKVVLADETSIKVHDRKKRGFMWTFLGEQLIAYIFSKDRSGQTPRQLLGGTTGCLIVDGYTGYNSVTKVDGRKRGGCLAHARRKFFDAAKDAPEESAFALERILDLYEVEHDALERGVVRTPAHLAMRQERSRPLIDSFHEWLEEQKPKHLPKGPMGKAIHYALNNWKALTLFLDDAAVPIDNNASERALRRVALGRKNFLFVGHPEAGRNIAVLYSLIASCERNDVNPQQYIADVLMRIQHHPASAIDDLLPDRWKPPPDG